MTRLDRYNKSPDDLTQKKVMMNTDQLKEKWMSFKDGLKQQWGKFINDDLEQIEGSFERSPWSNWPAPRIDASPLPRSTQGSDVSA
jgi:hypothetical protein